MMARQPRHRLAAAREDRPGNVLDLGSARHAAFAADLAHIPDLLNRDPDAAALLLDGLLQRISVEWFQARGLPVPPSDRLLERLAGEDAPFAWRLRLALRAPDVHARFVAAKHCLDGVSE